MDFFLKLFTPYAVLLRTYDKVIKQAIDHFKRALGAVANQVKFVEAWAPHVLDAEGVIIATSWPDYAALVNMDLSGKILFDARRMFKPEQVNGARYLTIGRRIAA